MDDKKGLWDVKGEKAPVWYTKDGKEPEAVRVGFVGQFEGNPASPHGEPAEGFSTADELLAHLKVCEGENGKMTQHLVFVKVEDLMDEEKGEQLRAVGIRHPGWYRWRMLFEAEGKDTNIDAELLTFIHKHEEEPASEEPPVEEPPAEEQP